VEERPGPSSLRRGLVALELVAQSGKDGDHRLCPGILLKMEMGKGKLQGNRQEQKEENGKTQGLPQNRAKWPGQNVA
jgi:hypothetical protein